MGTLGITAVLVGMLGAVVGGAMIDHDFYMIVTKGDNIPIVGMMLIVTYFTWLGISQGLKHDRLMEENDGDKQSVYDEMCK